MFEDGFARGGELFFRVGEDLYAALLHALEVHLVVLTRRFKRALRGLRHLGVDYRKIVLAQLVPRVRAHEVGERLNRVVEVVPVFHDAREVRRRGSGRYARHCVARILLHRGGQPGVRQGYRPVALRPDYLRVDGRKRHAREHAFVRVGVKRVLYLLRRRDAGHALNVEAEEFDAEARVVFGYPLREPAVGSEILRGALVAREHVEVGKLEARVELSGVRDERHVHSALHEIFVYERIVAELVRGVDLYRYPSVRALVDAARDVAHQLRRVMPVGELSREAQRDIGGLGAWRDENKEQKGG